MHRDGARYAVIFIYVCHFKFKEVAVLLKEVPL
jgi:hypothetical protein